jgi:hypothetical protein
MQAWTIKVILWSTLESLRRDDCSVCPYLRCWKWLQDAKGMKCRRERPARWAVKCNCSLNALLLLLLLLQVPWRHRRWFLCLLDQQRPLFRDRQSLFQFGRFN